MAPPRSGAYILISGQALVLGRSHFWVFPREDRRRRWRQTKPCQAFGTWWGSIQMPPHEASSSQINVISTNGDEINHTRDPFRRPDCHPPHQRWEKTQKSLRLAAEDRWQHTHVLFLPLTGMFISALVLLLPLIMTNIGSYNSSNFITENHCEMLLFFLSFSFFFTQQSMFKRSHVVVVFLYIFNKLILLVMFVWTKIGQSSVSLTQLSTFPNSSTQGSSHSLSNGLLLTACC